MRTVALVLLLSVIVAAQAAPPTNKRANSDGKLPVVAVLLQEGKDNPLVRELWSDLPKEKNKEDLLGNIQIDVSRILPSDRSYYTYFWVSHHAALQ